MGPAVAQHWATLTIQARGHDVSVDVPQMNASFVQKVNSAWTEMPVPVNHDSKSIKSKL